MKIKIIAAGLSFAFASLAAHATTIDFRTLTPGTAVTNQYPDFTASLSGGNASGAPTIASYTYGTGYMYGGLSNSPTAGEYPTAQFLNITFTSAVDALSFHFDNEGYNGANAWFTYDAANVLLETGALDTWDLISASKFGAKGVSMISFSNGMSAANGWDNWTQALSVLNYNLAPVRNDVPEPASLMLIGAGIAGLAAARRRKPA
jgi:hypothetical protein